MRTAHEADIPSNDAPPRFIPAKQNESFIFQSILIKRLSIKKREL